MADDLKPWEKAAQQQQQSNDDGGLKPWEKATAVKKKVSTPVSVGGVPLSGSGANPFQTPPSSSVPSVLTATGEVEYAEQVSKKPAQTAIEKAIAAYSNSQGEEATNEILTHSNNAVTPTVDADKGHQGNYGGYLYNQFLNGTGSLANAVTDIVFSVGKHLPTGDTYVESGKLQKDYREEGAEEVRGFLKENIGAEVDAGQERKYNDGFVSGAVGGLVNSGPAILAAGLTGGGSLFLQAYDGGLQSIEAQEGSELLDEDTKTIYAATVGAVVSQLEKYGLNKVIKGSGITNAIVKKIINSAKGSGGKVTGEVLEELIDKHLKGLANKYSKVGIKAFDGFMVEAGTGGTQDIATIGSENLLNEATGKSIFDTAEANTWKGFLDRVAKAAGQEGVGGGLMSGGIGIVTTKRKAKVAASQDLLNQIDENLDNPELSETSKEVLVQKKIKIQDDLEKQNELELAQQAKYTPEEAEKVVAFNEQLDKLEIVLADPAVPDAVKADLQEEFVKVEENIVALNESVARRPKAEPITEVDSDKDIAPIADEMVKLENEFNNRGFEIRDDYDNETIIINKKTGEQVEPEELDGEMLDLAGQYESALAGLSQYGNMGKLLSDARKRFKGEDVEFEDVTTAKLPEKKVTESKGVDILDTGFFGAGNGHNLEVRDSNKRLNDTYGTTDLNTTLKEFESLPEYKGYRVKVKSKNGKKLVSIHFEAYNPNSGRKGGHGAILFEVNGNVPADSDLIDKFLPVADKFKNDNYSIQNGLLRPTKAFEDFTPPDFSLADAPLPKNTPVQENVLPEQVKPEIPETDIEILDEVTEDNLTEEETQYQESTPEDLASQYHDEVTAPTHLSPKEQAIADMPFAITEESYNQFGDRNNKGQAKAKNYFSKNGRSADVIAQEVNNKQFNGNEVVTPQDIIDFIDRFPNGNDSVRTPSSNPKLQEINDAYFEKTGKKLNRATAKKYAEAAAKVKNAPDINKELADIIEGEGLTLKNLMNEEVQSIIDFLKPDEISLADATKFIKDYLNKDGKEKTTTGAEKESGERDSGSDADGGSVRSEGGRGTDRSERKTERSEIEDKTIFDQIFDTSDVKPMVDFLEGLKIKSGGIVQGKILILPELYNAAISIIQTAIKSGNSLKNAVKMAVDHLRQSGATDKEIKNFEDEFKGKIEREVADEPSIKRTIRENTDTRSKSKVVMTELNAIKKQMKDRFAGVKEGKKEQLGEQKQALKDLDDARKEAFAEYERDRTEKNKKKLDDLKAKYEEKLADQKEGFDNINDTAKAIREELLAVIKTAKTLKLFNGKHISQNALLNMVKMISAAGNNPTKLLSTVDFIIKRFEVMDYDNKVADAKKDISFLEKQYFPKNQKTVSDFLRLKPEDISAEDFYEYLKGIEDLKAHLDEKNPFEINNFKYIEDITAKQQLPSVNVVPPAPNNGVANVPNMEKPTRSFREKVVDGFKKFKANWLDFRQGMPKDIYALKEKMLGRIGVENYKAMQVAKDIEKLINKHKVKTEDVDAALRGDIDVLNSLPTEISDAVVAMRLHIDRLSQELIDKGFVPDSQKATIEVNLGTYLNRSYELFNNKNWTLENLPEPLYNRASQLLYNQYYKDYKIANPTLSEGEIQTAVKNRVEAKIREYFNKDSNDYFNDRNNGSKDLSIMMERADIPVELRELFGETTDPLHNYLMTVNKIAALVESNRFLHSVRENSLGSIMWEKNDINRPAEASVKIAAEGSESMGPLNGLYTTPEIAEAMKDHKEQVPGWMQFYLKAIGLVKMGKTVGSVITHIKNVEGNLGFVLANGHWPNGDMVTAWKAVAADFMGMNKKEIENIILPLIERGVIKQSVGANEIRAMFDPNRSADETFIRMFGKKKTIGGKIMSKVRNAGKFVTDTYQAEDDFFKIFAYMSDMKRYGEALKAKESTEVTVHDPNAANKPTANEALTDMVAELVKNTYPTFSRVPKIARIGSMYVPFFGNFVSFQAESYRVGYNIAKRAVTDIKSDNPEIRKIGAHRMAGIMSYMAIKNGLLLGVGNAGIGGLAGMLFDDDEKKQKNADARKYVAAFSKNSDILVMPTVKGKFNYIDMSSYDPWGSQMKVIHGALNGQSLPDVLADGMIQLVAPFLDTEITAGMINSLINNEDVYGRPIFNSEDDATPMAADIAKYIGKTIEPGTSSWLRRMATGGDETGEIKALAYRTYKVDIEQQFTFKMRDYKEREDKIQQIYKKEYYSKDSSPETRKERLENSQGKLDNLILEMHEDYEAAIRLGADPQAIRLLMKGMKMPKKKLNAILKGDPKLYNVKDRESKIPNSRKAD